MYILCIYVFIYLFVLLYVFISLFMFICLFICVYLFIYLYKASCKHKIKTNFLTLQYEGLLQKSRYYLVNNFEKNLTCEYALLCKFKESWWHSQH